jgi:hypothetical protein
MEQRIGAKRQEQTLGEARLRRSKDITPFTELTIPGAQGLKEARGRAFNARAAKRLKESGGQYGRVSLIRGGSVRGPLVPVIYQPQPLGSVRGVKIINVPFTTQATPAAGPVAARAAFRRKRIERAEAQRRQKEGLEKGRAIANLWSPRPSSWVEAIGYDKSSQTLAAVLSQILYMWRPVPEYVYTTWVASLSMCTTRDWEYIRRGLPPRWDQGKIPSLGATWHHGGVARFLSHTTRIM